jgi:WD40 repeat protein
MKLFVSYSKKDSTLVSTLVQELTILNNEVWHDQNLEGGQKWWNEILENIRQTDLFIFCLSSNYLDSKPCQLEQQYAKELNKKLLPIVVSEIEDIEWSDPSIQEIQYIKFLDNEIGSRKDLAVALNNIKPSHALPSPLPVPPPVPISVLAYISKQLENEQISKESQEEIYNALSEFYKANEKSSKVKILLKKLKEAPDIMKRISDQIDRLLEVSPNAIRSENCNKLKVESKFKFEQSIAKISFLPNSKNYVVGLNDGLIHFPWLNQKFELHNKEAEYSLKSFEILENPFALMIIGGQSIVIRSQLSTGDYKGNPYRHKVGIMEALSIDPDEIEKVISFTDYIPETLEMASDFDYSKIEEGKVRIWATQQGNTGNIHSGGGIFFCLGMSPDHSKLAIGTEDKSVIIYDLLWKRVLNRIELEAFDTIRSIIFDVHSDSLFIGDYNGVIYVWDFKKNQLLHHFQGHSRTITDFSISDKNTRLASASRDGTINIWDTKSWKKIKELSTNHSGVLCIEYSSVDDLLVAGYRDGGLLLWDTIKGKELKNLSIASSDDPVNSVSWSKDGASILSGHESGIVKLWSI